MSPGIDPKVDYAFKYLFGREVNKPLLIALIDAVLQPAPGHEIASLELLNPFNPKEEADDKLSILDIKAKDQSGRHFDVEMQMLAQRSYDRRIVYYAANFHRQQIREGQPYDDVRPTISISFLDHVMFPQANDVHLHFQLLEKKHHFALTDTLEFHLLQLPLFGKSADEVTSPLEQWLYFLRHAETMNSTELPPAMQGPELAIAFGSLNMLNQTDVEREQYEHRLKGLRDYRTNLIGREELLKEGKRQNAIWTIQKIERILRRVETPAEQFSRLSNDELNLLQERLIEELGTSKSAP